MIYKYLIAPQIKLWGNALAFGKKGRYKFGDATRRIGDQKIPIHNQDKGLLIAN